MTTTMAGDDDGHVVMVLSGAVDGEVSASTIGRVSGVGWRAGDDGGAVSTMSMYAGVRWSSAGVGCQGRDGMYVRMMGDR